MRNRFNLPSSLLEGDRREEFTGNSPLSKRTIAAVLMTVIIGLAVMANVSNLGFMANEIKDFASQTFNHLVKKTEKIKVEIQTSSRKVIYPEKEKEEDLKAERIIINLPEVANPIQPQVLMPVKPEDKKPVKKARKYESKKTVVVVKETTEEKDPWKDCNENNVSLPEGWR